MLGFQTEIVLDFDSGEITRQSGVLVLLWFGVQLELTKELTVLCKDWRDPFFIEHHKP